MATRAAAFGYDVSGQHSFVIACCRVPEVDVSIAEMGTWLCDQVGVK